MSAERPPQPPPGAPQPSNPSNPAVPSKRGRATDGVDWDDIATDGVHAIVVLAKILGTDEHGYVRMDRDGFLRVESTAQLNDLDATWLRDWAARNSIPLSR